MTAIILMLLAFPAVLFWSSGRAAAEQAGHFGRQLCMRAGVQWLDQSVHQVKLGIQRDDSGRLCWKRIYQYEYSHDGHDRYAATITLVGGRAVSWVEPVAKSPDPFT
ncbi:MAG: DUF3301 domain-containing protein [Xanthomonadaceae bacterium]|jgi:hypothetical protein|nr:DUF3301 domain-containing protein [Xanthomonadaceae bacterium]